MLGKLLRYDFRALNRVMLPLQGAVLLSGILGCFLMRFFSSGVSAGVSYSYSRTYSEQMLPLESILSATMAMLAGLFFAAAFASSWITIFLIARHLYRSFVKDEGYLTFTLPVTTSQHLISKIIAGGVWVLVNTVILCIIVLLLSLVGFSFDGSLINRGVLEFYGDVLAGLASAQGALFIVEALVLLLIYCVFAVLHVYTSLILGGAAAKTHKVLAAIGIYVLISVVVQAIAGFVFFGTLFTYSYDSAMFSNFARSWFMQLQPIVLPALILYAIFVVVGFIVSRYALNHKLNLD